MCVKAAGKVKTHEGRCCEYIVGSILRSAEEGAHFTLFTGAVETGGAQFAPFVGAVETGGGVRAVISD